MAKKRIYRTNERSAEQIARDHELRSKYLTTRPSLAALVASGEYTPPVKQGEYLALIQFAAQLKALREKLQLSLSDVAARSGIDKAAISRLENGLADNPTVGTLERLARSMGKRLKLALEDDQALATR